MTLSKRQDGYLNQWVILFILKYETHSLQMHPESPCRSVVAPTPKLLEVQYTLRLVVVPCRYFPSPSPFFQPISPSLPFYISYVADLHLLFCRIHTCCPTSPPLCSSSAVFTAELVFHPHYPTSPPRLHFHPPASLLRFSSHYLPSSRVFRRRCLSTFLDRIFPLLYVVLYYTSYSTLLRTTFLTLQYNLLTAIFFYLFHSSSIYI